MQRRVLVGLGLGAVVAAVAFYATRDDAAAPARRAASDAPARAPQPSARRPTRSAPGATVRDPEADREYINGKDLSDVSPAVKKWKEPGLPGTFREIVAPDDSENVEEKLTYRTRRLRFQLNDVAARCYDGDGGNESIALRYELVVAAGTLTVEGVEVIASSIDATLQDCIVGAVRSLRAPAPDLPDLRKKQESTMALDDLADRNRRVD